MRTIGTWCATRQARSLFFYLMGAVRRAREHVLVLGSRVILIRGLAVPQVAILIPLVKVLILSAVVLVLATRQQIPHARPHFPGTPRGLRERLEMKRYVGSAGGL